MIESIAFALVLKKIQIALIALGVLVASALSIYNLPWGGVEWETLTTVSYTHLTLPTICSV